MSRLSIDVLGSNKDYTNNPKFSVSRKNGRYFSPVYFRRQSEPYLSMGVRGQGREKGVRV